MMKLIFGLFAHWMVTLATLLRLGGLKTVIAKNPLLKHQPLMLQAYIRTNFGFRRWPNRRECSFPEIGD